MATGSELLKMPSGGMRTRQELMASEVGPAADSTSQALVAQARAEVEARIAAARRWPRDVDNVRVNLLAACDRSRFAEVSRYAKPIGDDFVRGWSIRFAEEVYRLMGNLHSGSLFLVDDDTNRLVKVFVIDLETNAYREKIFGIKKTVERKFLKAGQRALADRVNSYGKTVYLVEATDDEVNTKTDALTQKAWRNLVLGFLPPDISDECLDRVTVTQTRTDKQDPTAARKKVADAFAELGVKPSDLKDYLGHDLATCSPAELADLRTIYGGIRDGEMTWAEALAARGAGDAPAGGAAPAGVPSVMSTGGAGAAATKPAPQAAPAAAAPPAPSEPAPQAAPPPAPEQAAAAPAATPAPQASTASAIGIEEWTRRLAAEKTKRGLDKVASEFATQGRAEDRQAFTTAYQARKGELGKAAPAAAGGTAAQGSLPTGGQG